MANKRIVKKQIRNLCGAIADELLYASCFIESFDDEKTDKLVARAADKIDKRPVALQFCVRQKQERIRFRA